MKMDVFDCVWIVFGCVWVVFWHVSAILFLFWASLILPMIALSLFVSTASSWATVLGPLQAVITLGAGLLLVPMTLGEFLSLLGGSTIEEPALEA